MTESQTDFPRSLPDSITVDVSNVGGIDQCSVELEKGTNILTGRNATNRTSFLHALASSLGGETAAVKSDSDEGTVALHVGNESYLRTLRNSDSGTQFTGSPYSTDASIIDLFVAILGDNPIRNSVEHSNDLRDIVMRPVDTDKIERRIQNFREKKTSLESELQDVQQQRNRLPQLEEQRQDYREKIENVDDQLADLRDTVADFEADAKLAEQADQLVDQLDEKRHQLKQTENQIEVATAEIEALEDEIAELQTEQSNLSEYDRTDLSEVQQDLEQLRQEKRDIEEKVNNISSIIQFNEEVMKDDSNPLPTVESSSDLTDQLAPREQRTIECWTCGSSTTYGDIADRLESLREVVQQMRNDKTEVEAEIDELRSQEQEIKEAINRHNDIEYQLDTAKTKLERKNEEINNLEAEKERLQEEIADLEERVAETEELRDNDILETYERITDLEYERGELSQKLDSIESEIEGVTELPEESVLQEQIEELKHEIERERTRIESLETEVVDQFNQHMAEVLDILDYQNIERVWIERILPTQSNDETTFELHVVRKDDSGSVYEDIVSNLSESEREVIGLITALAGYLAYDVHRDVPFMLLDSLEAIDAERIPDLVQYFSEFVPYLIVALLPEDAQRVSADYHLVSAAELN